MKNPIKLLYRTIIDHSPWKVRYIDYYVKTKKRIPNIFCPRDYSEYIFRDNLLDKHIKHAYLADKYEVRKYVKERGLAHTLTKLYGVWDDANKIDFDSLPDQFAIKCNHSCGMNIICFDKSKLDIEQTIRQLNEWLHQKHEIIFEHHYHYIKPLIICEELIPNNEDGFFPMDYKIHCANGKPVYIQCCLERSEKDAGRRVIYSIDWKDLHYVIQDEHYTDKDIPCPKHLKEMLEYAAVLSKGLKYARIDFYDTDSRVIFGEVTLTPMGGLLSYFTTEALQVMGNAIRNK